MIERFEHANLTLTHLAEAIGLASCNPNDSRCWRTPALKDDDTGRREFARRLRVFLEGGSAGMLADERVRLLRDYARREGLSDVAR